MKKIGLFLDTLPHTGGVYQYNLSILKAVAALQGNGYDVIVAYTSPQWEERLAACNVPSLYVNYHFPARLLSIWLNIFSLPVSIWQKLSVCMFRYARVLSRQQCDLWIFPSQDAVSYQVRLPALVTILDLAHRYAKQFPEAASRFESILRERNYLNLCHTARGILVDSQTGRNQVAESYHVPPEMIHPLPYIAPDYIHSDTIPDGFASRYHLPEKYLFYPAQFWEHKNHRNLILAISQLKPEFPDIKLVLAGSKKNAYDSIVSLVAELQLTEDILFLGYVANEDMPELYRRARALVMPTYFGPTNIPPLEATAVGCPVAISDVSGMPDQLGDDALIFNPDSIDEIAATVRQLWIDDLLCSRLSQQGKKRAANWGQPEFNARLEQIISTVLKNQQSRGIPAP